MKRKKYSDQMRQLINYFIFGVISVVINIVIYYGSIEYAEIHYLIANILAWLASVAFSFLSNKLFVFRDYSWEWVGCIKQFVMFLGARLATGGVDMLGMFIMVDIVLIDQMVSKVFINIIVIILNYLLSRLWVFRKSEC